MIKAAIFGYGTVGSGIYEVLTRNSAVIQGKLGDRIEVKYVLDLREFPGDPVQDVLVHDVNTIWMMKKYLLSARRWVERSRHMISPDAH